MENGAIRGHAELSPSFGKQQKRHFFWGDEAPLEAAAKAQGLILEYLSNNNFQTTFSHPIRTKYIHIEYVLLTPPLTWGGLPAPTPPHILSRPPYS